MNESINRTPLIAGNWKMNTTLESGAELARGILEGVSSIDAGFSTPRWEIGFYPPATSLGLIADLCAGFDACKVLVGAQNMHAESSGAFTGEISANMIASCNADYVIIGHSERREYFNETNEDLTQKVNRALENKLKVIFCCGESLSQRDNGVHFDWVKQQLSESVFHLSSDQFNKLVIAYEPIWAIGTGKTASTEQAQEMHAFVRNLLDKKYGMEIAENTSILYGGSCKPTNTKDLFGQQDIDGGLIGGACLNADDFLAIVNSF